MKSLTVTTQNHRELLTWHKLRHTQCLGQLSNSSRRKIQKLKATFYWLTRQTEQQPSFDNVNPASATLTAAGAEGVRPHPPAAIPIRSVRMQWGCCAALPDGQRAFSKGKAMMLHVNVVLIPQASPTHTCWLRWGYTGKVAGKGGIPFMWSEGFFISYGERKLSCLGTFFSL